jgi:hypothetical protein
MRVVTERPDLWLVDLRTRMLEAGHLRARVDEEIARALARFAAMRISMFTPLLVVRTVEQRLSRVESPYDATDRRATR